MLRDDRAGGEGRRQAARNVLGEALEICSFTPMTGFYRDGCCNTGREDVGSHTVCAVMTSEFLKFSKSCVKVAQKVPQARSHMFFVKDDEVILVSSSDRRVADVIKKKSTD